MVMMGACASFSSGLPRVAISSSHYFFHRNHVRVPLLLIPLRCSSSSSSSSSSLGITNSRHRSWSSSPYLSAHLFCASSSSSLRFKHRYLSNVRNDDGFQEESASEEEISQQQEQEQEQKQIPSLPVPDLSVKEKKELSSYAHSLRKKLKSQQVGKSGVTASVAFSLIETLESNELLKLKIHGSCPGELSDVIKQLEKATGSVAVDQIGRSVILYRPSLSKMKVRDATKLKEYHTSSGRTQKKVPSS